jgi:hypothetical protein
MHSECDGTFSEARRCSSLSLGGMGSGPAGLQRRKSTRAALAVPAEAGGGLPAVASSARIASARASERVSCVVAVRHHKPTRYIRGR